MQTINLIENQAYYKGNIAGNWIGAVGGNTPQEVAATKAYIEKIFTNTNIVKGCVNRFVDSMVSDAPLIELKPVGKVKKSVVDASQADMNTLIISLNQMANMLSDKSSNLIRDWTLKALVEGKAWLRLFLPKHYRNNKNPYMKMSAEVVSDSSVEVENDDEGAPISLTYTIDNSDLTKMRWERQVLDPDSGILTVESYSSEQKLKDRTPDASQTLDLGNNWALIPLSFDSPITETVKRQQDNIGMLLTMSNRLAVTAGFAERYLINALPLGEEVKQPDGTFAFQPTPNASLTLGASIVNYVQGVPKGLQNEDVTNPEVYIKEPSSCEALLKQLQVLIEALYQEFSQLHILSNNQGTISAQSRLQQRQDFSNKVKDYAKTLEPALGSFYKAALMLFGIVSGNNNYGAFDVVAKLKISSIVLTPEEHNAIREDFLNQLIPHETALSELGYDNPLELIARIEEEQVNKNYSLPYETQPKFNLKDAVDAEKLMGKIEI